MSYNWNPQPKELLRVAEAIDEGTCIGLGALAPTEFRWMITTFCGDSGNFEFNQMKRSEPNVQECRVLACCFAAAMLEAGDF